MKLREFLKTYKIPVPEFADAIGVKANTLRPYMYGSRKPSLETAYRIIVQSGYQVTLEDLADPIDTQWKPRKLKTTAKVIVGGLDTTKLRKHERKKYFDDLETI